MDTRYEAYCLADLRYYDSPERADAGADHPAYRVELGSGWEVVPDGEWTYCFPSRPNLPAQGWKIHVSATLDNAAEVLEKTMSYCANRRVPFKYASNRSVLLARNAKYAPRESSGKFLTLYPRDATELHRVLLELDNVLSGSSGPYILSDLRWRGGPLYVRYGAYAQRHTYTDDGIRVPAIQHPDGHLVPDAREARFVVPSWVTVPDFLVEAATLRLDATRPDEFPYDILGVLHFSNGGGVYKARRRSDGVPLVLKEARPHAGLDARGRDAITRLRNEYSVLLDLDGAVGVPHVHDYLTVGDHEFLAMDFLPGTSLHSWLATNYPFVRRACDEEDDARYLASVRRIVRRLNAVVAAIHAKNYLIGDLHPDNVVVDDDEEVSLIDFEMATPMDVPDLRALGAPGFVAPETVRGVDADHYSTAAIELYLYLPMNSLLWLCPDKVAILLAHAQSRFHLEQTVVDTLAAQLLTGGSTGSPLRPVGDDLAFTATGGRWTRQVTALVASIRASATPKRQDRLFPGDIAQFEHGGGGFAFGAAGVIDTLATAGCGDLDQYLEWLVADARRGQVRLGLYDGLAGTCYVLDRLGQHQAASELFGRCADRLDEVAGAKLFDGLSGIGLAALHLRGRTGTAWHLEVAGRAAWAVASAIESGSFTAGAEARHAGPRGRRGNSTSSFHGGMLYGWSGLALFMVRMYEITGEGQWLDLAVKALERDLDMCEVMPGGSLELRNADRLLPYLATGSAGIALVCDLVLRHRREDRIEESMTGLALACAADACVCGGLFNGRVGLIYTLRRLRDRLAWPDLEERIDAGVRSLDLYVVRDEVGLIIPGEQNIRLSTDVATGSAGLLRLLNVLTGRSDEALPFTGPRAWTPRPKTSGQVGQPMRRGGENHHGRVRAEPAGSARAVPVQPGG